MPHDPLVIVEAARELIAAEARAVAATADRLDDGFAAVVELLAGLQGKVITTGAGTSGLVAARVAHLLALCGTPATYLHPTEALHGSLGAVTAEDAVLAFSKGGTSEEVNTVAARARDRGASVVAVTARPASVLAGTAQLVSVVDAEDADPGGLVAMGSTLAASAWGDALALVLMRIRRHGWADVLALHPAGYVGTVGAARDLPAELDPLPEVAS